MIKTNGMDESAAFVPGKVCVAVTGHTAAELITRSTALLSESSFQELRLDYLADPSDVPDALDSLRGHITRFPAATFLATCRRTASGGRYTGSPNDELQLLLAAVRTGFRWVDLSLESAEALPGDAVPHLKAAGANVLLSWHDFDGSSEVGTVLERMRPFAPDLYKIVPTANTLDDSLSLLRLLQDHRAQGPQIVAVAMGEPGIPTRVLGLRHGSAFTFAAPTTEEATAPGQIAARTLRELYRAETINAETKIFGVAGDPIRSSLSPLMLNTAFREAGLNAVYLPLLTHDAEELFRFARALSLAGFSITMPLKQAALPLLDHIDPLAASIGAVNTVRLEADGTYTGFNTDAAGITGPLEQRLSLHGARVLVLGAGGAARAAVFACAHKGAQISILNRTPSAAAQLAQQSGAAVLMPSDLAQLAPFDVLINATPAGMHGNNTPMPLAADQLRANLIFDLVYNPLETPLLKAAQAQGIETISGVEMFVHQGARQFELWTGTPAPAAIMRTVVLEALRTRQTAAS